MSQLVLWLISFALATPFAAWVWFRAAALSAHQLAPRANEARVKELEYELGIMDDDEARTYAYTQAQSTMRWQSPSLQALRRVTDEPGAVVEHREHDELLRGRDEYLRALARASGSALSSVPVEEEHA